MAPHQTLISHSSAALIFNQNHRIQVSKPTAARPNPLLDCGGVFQFPSFPSSSINMPILEFLYLVNISLLAIYGLHSLFYTWIYWRFHRQESRLIGASSRTVSLVENQGGFQALGKRDFRRTKFRSTKYGRLGSKIPPSWCNCRCTTNVMWWCV